MPSMLNKAISLPLTLTKRACPGAISLALATFTNSGHAPCFVLSVVDAEAAVPCSRRKRSELRVAHVNQRLMIAALQVYLGLILDAVVDHRIKPIAFTRWRNRAGHAVIE